MPNRVLEPLAAEMTKQLDASVADVFELMLGMSCTPVEADNSRIDSIKVTIGFSGSIEGSCRLCLSSDAARKAMNALMGEDPDCGESMVEDTARELCNLIVGGWKSRLPPLEAAAILSVPVAFNGDETDVNPDSLRNVRRLYSFDGNFLLMALAIRDSSLNEAFSSYLTTD
jgi:CheY-specific phosphatase CheX